MGGENDEWRGGVERRNAWMELSGVEYEEHAEGEYVREGGEFLTVQIGPRDTLNEKVINRVLGRKATGPTSYAFCECRAYFLLALD